MAISETLPEGDSCPFFAAQTLRRKMVARNEGGSIPLLLVGQAQPAQPTEQSQSICKSGMISMKDFFQEGSF